MRRRFLQGLIALICVIVGLICRAWLMNIRAVSKINTWRKADLPRDARAGNFLAVNDDYLYLQSRDGRFFAHSLATGIPPQWFEIEPIWVGELNGLGRSDCDATPQTWKPAIHSAPPLLQGVNCGYWDYDGAFSKSSFAILEDGSVWRWHQTPGFRIQILGTLLFTILGMIICSLLTWVIVRLLKNE